MSLKNRVSNALRELRINHGLSQLELADKVGIDNSSIHRYESGERNLSIEKLEEIAYGLGYNVKVVFEEKPVIPKLKRVEV